MKSEELRNKFEKETGMTPFSCLKATYAYIEWFEKMIENQPPKPILPAVIEYYKEAGEILNIRHKGWNACLAEIKKLNN